MGQFTQETSHKTTLMGRVKKISRMEVCSKGSSWMVNSTGKASISSRLMVRSTMECGLIMRSKDKV